MTRSVPSNLKGYKRQVVRNVGPDEAQRIAQHIVDGSVLLNPAPGHP